MRRHEFLWLTLLMAGLVTPSPGAENLVLKVATEDHPHVQALRDGRVKLGGCDLLFSTGTLKSIQADLAGAKMWDAVEVELIPFIVKQSSGEWSDYTLLPVFLSREFQLRNMYIRTDRGIQTPQDLRGKTIGLSHYDGTRSTWLRGMLQSSWSVKPSEITWLQTDTATDSAASLSSWLASGKVDAVFSRVPPQAFLDKNPKVTRMYADFRPLEGQRFAQTRVFPVITALAVKKELIQKYPWLPESLFRAFSQAKGKALEDSTMPMPWDGATRADVETLMGEHFWSYGVKSNPKTLGALFRYAQQQGLLIRPLTINDVFEPSTQMLLEN